MIERNSEKLDVVFSRYHRMMIDDVRQEVKEELQKEKKEEGKIKIKNIANEKKMEE